MPIKSSLPLLWHISTHRLDPGSGFFPGSNQHRRGGDGLTGHRALFQIAVAGMGNAAIEAVLFDALFANVLSLGLPALGAFAGDRAALAQGDGAVVAIEKPHGVEGDDHISNTLGT